MKIAEGSRPGDLVFTLILLAFSAWAFWQAYGISGFDSLSGPGVFPMLASGLMVLSALAILAKSLRNMSAARSPDTGFLPYLFPVRFLVFVPMMVAFAVAMPWIGFFLSAAGFVFASIAFLWRKNFVWTVMITALSIGGIYVVFRVIFQVVLPSGSVWQ